MKRTPFYDKLVENGGRMVEFTGYCLPIQFSEGILSEHRAVRNAVGMFDVSHMGEFLISGRDALANIQNLVSNDMENLVSGKARYTLVLNERGGVVDDILVYCINNETYFVVVNAANMEKDEIWFKTHLFGMVDFKNLSSETAQLAIQGPKAIKVIEKLFDVANIPEKNYTFKITELLDGRVILSRTGYTGEDGFELYVGNEYASKVFDLLVEMGKSDGLTLCGLGARDTLRLEAAMPLYGHEMNEDTLATELGLNFFIKFNKEFFIGKEALEDKKQVYRRAGIKLLDRGIARDGANVYGNGEIIGVVTSGTVSPTLGDSIAMVRINKDYSLDTVEVEVRNKKLKAELITLPFYSRKK